MQIMAKQPRNKALEHAATIQLGDGFCSRDFHEQIKRQSPQSDTSQECSDIYYGRPYYLSIIQFVLMVL